MSAEYNPFRRTPVAMRQCPEPIGKKEHSLWLGSCFTENLGPWLSSLGYPVLANPFGVIFHPLIMGKLLFSDLTEIQSYNFCKEGVWLNFLLGSPFAAASEEELNEQIHQASSACRQHLESADWLVLTFGTAFIYQHEVRGMVGKCHKLPAREFEKCLSSIEEIASSWKAWILKLRESNPGLRILLSLSPVRHSRDGLEENALSKSILRLAIEEIKTGLPSVYYFPAWEIMNDELRDYRFYGTDLVHPTEEAVDYLRQHFEQRFLRAEDEKARRLAEEILMMEKHRPMASWSLEADRWKARLEEKKAAFVSLSESKSKA